MPRRSSARRRLNTACSDDASTALCIRSLHTHFCELQTFPTTVIDSSQVNRGAFTPCSGVKARSSTTRSQRAVRLCEAAPRNGRTSSEFGRARWSVRLFITPHIWAKGPEASKPQDSSAKKTGHPTQGWQIVQVLCKCSTAAKRHHSNSTREAQLRTRAATSVSRGPAAQLS